MDDITAVRARLEQASDLPGILDAAYEAFEGMLPVIWGQAERAGGGLAAFVMAGASAANGRDAVASAPSLPPASPGHAPLAASDPAAGVTEQEAAAALAGLSGLLACRLTDAASWAAGAADRAACADAAGHAGAIWSLLAGAPGR
jgi:hypothetical protein